LRKLTCCACRAVKKQAIKAKQPIVFCLKYAVGSINLLRFVLIGLRILKTDGTVGCSALFSYGTGYTLQALHCTALHFASLRGFPNTNGKQNDLLRLIIQPGGRFYPAALERLIFMKLLLCNV